MPKRVDRAKQRAQIAEAVLRVAATGGIEAVSLRNVAAEAGVSMGMVQYYFTSKDRMLLFACQYLVERSRAQIEERLAKLPSPPSSRAILRQIMIQLQPLDDERRAGTRIWLAFLARAAVEPELAAFMRSTWITSHASISEVIATAQQRGELPTDLDPDLETTHALGFADGLVSHVLFGHYSPEEAITAIDAYLDRLFGDQQ